MTSKSSHSIKKRNKRNKANDVFITPLELAKLNIDMIDSIPDDIWLDPCKNDGSYYNQFPTDNKEYCEILEKKDFFKYTGKPDIIIQNPPYSLMDSWIKKNIELNPRIISMLIGVNNLTARRLEWLEDAGYGITKLKMLKVWKWFGMSYIVVFEKNKESIMSYNRKVWREEKQPEKKKNKFKVIKKI